MTAHQTRTSTDYLLFDDFAPSEKAGRSNGLPEVSEAQAQPLDLAILSVIATAVICGIALFLGWQIALIIIAGLIVKTVSERRESTHASRR